MISTIHRTLAVACSLLLLAGAPARAQGEPQAFNAFAIAVANGSILKSGEKQVTVVGTLAGPLFIETDEGPVGSGKVVCAGTVQVDQESSHQSANGACTFTTQDGAIAWGDWKCAGYQLVGCRGTLTLTGGTERLAGVTGGGAMVWRPSAHEFKKQLDGTILQDTSGVLVWRDFKLMKKK